VTPKSERLLDQADDAVTPAHQARLRAAAAAELEREARAAAAELERVVDLAEGTTLEDVAETVGTLWGRLLQRLPGRRLAVLERVEQKGGDRL
jgi:hypothetical protein